MATTSQKPPGEHTNTHTRTQTHTIYHSVVWRHLDDKLVCWHSTLLEHQLGGVAVLLIRLLREHQSVFQVVVAHAQLNLCFGRPNKRSKIIIKSPLFNKKC